MKAVKVKCLKLLSNKCCHADRCVAVPGYGDKVSSKTFRTLIVLLENRAVQKGDFQDE